MTISIITAYYNGRRFLEGYIKMIMRNVKSIRESDIGHVGVEAILVNDSPDDGLIIEDIEAISKRVLSDKCTFSVIKNSLLIEFGDESVMIRLLTNESNMGIHASRVRGFKESIGDYIIFIDQDDLLSRNALATYAANVSSSAEVLVANAALGQVDGYLKWYRSKYHADKIGDLDTYVDVGIQIISPGHTCISRMAIPNEWLEYICVNNGADDYFLWLLMIASGVSFKYIDKVLYLHAYTGDNLSHDTTITDTSIYEFCDYLEEIPYFPDKYVRKLKRMINYKADFRAGSLIDKGLSSLRNIDILTANAVYKYRSGTPLGFNRQ